MWPINSEIYFLTITGAFFLPWEMRTLWSQKCNYFSYHCELSWKKRWNTEKKDWKRIQAFFFLCHSLINSVICWKSAQFPDNWSWHSSLDRVGRRCEFQQISELWIRIVYLHANCLKRLSVIRKSKEWLRRHQRTDMWQSVNRRVY